MSSILSTSELAGIISEVRSIIGDGTIGTTIQYHKYSGTTAVTWSPTTALIPDMYSTSSVSAFKGGYTPQEISLSGGEIQRSDVKFIIIRSDVSGVLSVDDRIVESGSNYQSATTYEIKSVGRDPLAICYYFQARTI